jgi:hypothetical protein
MQYKGQGGWKKYHGRIRVGNWVFLTMIRNTSVLAEWWGKTKRTLNPFLPVKTACGLQSYFFLCSRRRWFAQIFRVPLREAQKRTMSVRSSSQSSVAFLRQSLAILLLLADFKTLSSFASREIPAFSSELARNAYEYLENVWARCKPREKYIGISILLQYSYWNKYLRDVGIF